ncbi:M23 family metallopeptidase [Sulfitobacter aestuariivivens]|nr:M23 family metallopeptidase [Sulfitobacter aestuariivivens]
MALALASASPVLAEAPTLASPIDCDLTETCFILQYMDHDPGSGASDFRCSPLSYDTHSGTDFALPSDAMMQAGVDVLASAPGTVVGIRDGMPDTGLTADTAAQIAGRECGNGVRLDHGGGWTTQYCHLKQGTIAVQPGDIIETGAILGQVGQSGRAEFPHVHLSLEKDGQDVDPYDPDGDITCGAPGTDTLWATAPPYRPGGLITLGFADHVPEYTAIKAGTADHSDLTKTAPALVIWSYNFGIRAGDILQLDLTGPDGPVIARDITLDRTQALNFRAIGKKRRTAEWPAGTYTGTATLIRAEQQIEKKQITLTLR